MQYLDVVKAVGHFSGGNDEGFMDTVDLTYSNGEVETKWEETTTQSYDVVQINGRPQSVLYKTLTHPKQRAVNIISGVLWQPIVSKYGGFSGEGHASGYVTVDRSGEVTLKDQWEPYESWD